MSCDPTALNPSLSTPNFIELARTTSDEVARLPSVTLISGGPTDPRYWITWSSKR